MIKEEKHLLYEERLRDGTAQPGEEKAQVDLINVYKQLVWCQEDKGRFYSVMLSDRRRGSARKLKYKKFCSNVGENFFTLGVIGHCNK